MYDLLQHIITNDHGEMTILAAISNEYWNWMVWRIRWIWK